MINYPGAYAVDAVSTYPYVYPSSPAGTNLSASADQLNAIFGSRAAKPLWLRPRAQRRLPTRLKTDVTAPAVSPNTPIALYTLPLGSHTLTAYATDQAGNSTS